MPQPEPSNTNEAARVMLPTWVRVTVYGRDLQHPEIDKGHRVAAGRYLTFQVPDKWPDLPRVEAFITRLELGPAKLYAVVHDDQHESIDGVYVVQQNEITSVGEQEFEDEFGFGAMELIDHARLNAEFETLLTG